MNRHFQRRDAPRARPPERSGASGPHERRRWGVRGGEAPGLLKSAANDLLESRLQVIESIPSASRVVITGRQLLREQRGAILHWLERGPLVPLVECADVDDEEASPGIAQSRIRLHIQ